MKTRSLMRLAACVLSFLSFISFGDHFAQGQTVPFAVSFWYPTNGENFTAPANIGVHAQVTDSNVVKTVQYFSGTTSIGIVSNTSNILLTNSSIQDSPFYMLWSNVPAGTYTLRAVATDSAGAMASAAPVTLTVSNPPPPKPVVYIYSPTNNSKYAAPASLTIYARAVETGGTIATVTFLANNNVLGIVSSNNQAVYTNISTEPLYTLAWSNVLAGNYALTAIATDLAGNSTTSAVVNISVTNLPPPVPLAIAFRYPTNGESYTAPANIGLSVIVVDSNVVRTVHYFSGNTSIGIVSNTANTLLTNSTQSNPFSMTWSNVLAGQYALTAVATDTAGHQATSAPVNITVTNPPPPRPVVYIYSPTNNSKYTAPANLTLYARAVETGGTVATVTFVANSNILGIVSNLSQAVYTNISTELLYALPWSNVLAGNYSLTAIATDLSGNSTTSAVVSISVTNPPPPPHPSVYIYSPTNNSKYITPANLTIYARAVESGGTVATVTFLANSTILGVVSNSSQTVYTNISTEPLFAWPWSNVPIGHYALTAIATDLLGNSTTSTVVNISVTNPPPPVPFIVSFYYPTNGQTFVAPANIGVHAMVTDSNVVRTVQYFANGASIGIVSNSSNVLLTNSTAGNPFFLSWSNVPAGQYALTAVATDSAGAQATSAPVTIWVLAGPPPVVTIYAPDPVAVVGTNCGEWLTIPTAYTNYSTGSNTATFLVRRNTGTNVDLTVYYTESGTATNGVDYVTLSGNVIIPTGQTYALITITPLTNSAISTNERYASVILSLLAPPVSVNSPATYSVGSPSKAGAAILECTYLPMTEPQIHNFTDGSAHLSLPAVDGSNFILQSSPDLINWQSICTNTVLKGSAHYVEPDITGNPALFYRIIVSDSPPNY